MEEWSTLHNHLQSVTAESEEDRDETIFTIPSTMANLLPNGKHVFIQILSLFQTFIVKYMIQNLMLPYSIEHTTRVSKRHTDIFIYPSQNDKLGEKT